MPDQPPPQQPPQDQPRIPESQATQIREYVFAGRKIEAIKLLRQSTGLQLVDAKTVVDQLEAQLRQESPEKFTAGKSGCTVRAGMFLLALLILLAACAFAPAASRAAPFLKNDDAWFSSDEGKRITANILSWQSDEGDWPKNTDTATVPYSGDRAKLHGTFDNSATTDEIRFLARAFLATHDEKCRDAALKGIDHILAAQYDNGGWPQNFPHGKGYPRHITFNDDAMVRLMIFVREVARDEKWNFAGDDRRKKSADAFERGVQCILKCQIRDKTGHLTVWCAQHDEETFEPRPARTYELPSYSGSESVGIVRLLMSLEKPSPEIIASIDAAVAWFKTARIPGIKMIEVPDEKSPKGKDKRIVEDPSAPGLWARFYDLQTGQPFFCDRDGIPKATLAEIGYERRNGYAWYGEWPRDLIEKEYPEWKKNHPSPAP